ncbi:MAG TPA: hypothetical protein VF796_30610, partial [Humisphaera sp.]
MLTRWILLAPPTGDPKMVLTLVRRHCAHSKVQPWWREQETVMESLWSTAARGCGATGHDRATPNEAIESEGIRGTEAGEDARGPWCGHYAVASGGEGEALNEAIAVALTGRPAMGPESEGGVPRPRAPAPA